MRADDIPAFPVTESAGMKREFLGMTLRDYFAAKAMAVILQHDLPERPDHYIAKDAYKIADAMLAERNKS